MILPVLDSKMRVTDTQVLSMLTASKTDAAFVEFHDYDRTRPYSKLYVDRKSDQRILVSSGLPMVRKTDGTRLTPGWEAGVGGVYHLKNNLFEGYVTPDGQYHIAVVNDQPTGPIAGDEAHWTPVLTVGGEVVKPKSCTILETDPTNENYHDNVIEWDYGVCKRHIRVIEGRFRGSWIFASDPGADVRIDYHCEGKLLHKYGRAYDRDMNVVEVQLPVKDSEYIPASAFKGAAYPVTVGDTGTYYPDANPESATVDGYIGGAWSFEEEITWATARGMTSGNYRADSANWGYFSQVSCHDEGWGYINVLLRSMFLFNTASIPDDATISFAEIWLYGTDGYSFAPIYYRYYLVSANPASNTELIAADVDKFGSTAFTYSGFSGWGTSGWNGSGLNATGIAAINKTGVTKFGLRHYHDIYSTETPFNDDSTGLGLIGGYFAERGDGYKPKLVVTYSTAAAAKLQDSHARRRR